MDYERRYNELVKKAKYRRPDFGSAKYEKHHIIPKSCGGGNARTNLVFFTLKEHFIAHRLLEKFTAIKYGIDSKQHRYMAQAIWLMMHNNKYPEIKLTSRSYSQIREVYIRSITGPNSRLFGKRGTLSKAFGKKQSEKSKQRNRESHLRRKHMHHPITDVGIVVPRDEVDAYLAKGYLLGMSKHERASKAESGRKQKHMYHPITDKQVYAQPEDVQKYLSQGYIFGRSQKSRDKHNEYLRGRIAFYNKFTGKRFYVERSEVIQTIKQGHNPGESAKRIINERN